MEIGNPLQLPEKLIRGALDEIVSFRRAIDQLEPAMESVRRLEAVADEVLPVAERGIDAIERLTVTIDAASDDIDPLVKTIDGASTQVGPLITSVDEARAKVDPLIATLEAALPSLEKAVGLAEPMEGSVERLGRVLDRLPGGRDSRRARRSADEDEEAATEAGAEAGTDADRPGPEAIEPPPRA